jgi:hypothetical protein
MGNEEAFSRYTIEALFARHEDVSGQLSTREQTLQVCVCVCVYVCVNARACVTVMGFDRVCR